MAPLLRDGDRVTVASAKTIEPGLIVVAGPPTSEPVCHRVLAVGERGVVLAGDRSRAVLELPRESVLGVAQAVDRGGRRLRLDAPWLRPADRALTALHEYTWRGHRRRPGSRRAAELLRRALLRLRALAWLTAGRA